MKHRLTALALLLCFASAASAQDQVEVEWFVNGVSLGHASSATITNPTQDPHILWYLDYETRQWKPILLPPLGSEDLDATDASIGTGTDLDLHMLNGSPCSVELNDA